MVVTQRLNHVFLSQVLLVVFLVACGQPASPDPATVTAGPTKTDSPPTPTAVPPTETPIPPTPTPVQATPTMAPEEVIVIEDVLYARAVDPLADDQHLDIYAPGSPGQYPAVIWAHGSNQDKSTGKTLGRILARQGFVVLSIDWQDGSDSKDVDNVPRLLREVIESGHCVLSFVASQAEAYGADPQGVIWAGFSAGSYFGSFLAFVNRDVPVDWALFAYEGEATPGQQIECAVEASPAPIIVYVSNSGAFPELLWYEAGGDQDLPAEFTGLRQLVAIGNNPGLKVRLIHGSFDVTTPLEDAERFYDALVEAGYDVAFFKEQGGHLPFLQQVIDQILLLAVQ